MPIDITDDKIYSESNIVDDIKDSVLDKMGAELVQGFNGDEDSRRPWLDNISQWTFLAMQIAERKTFPWPGASNIQYPLLATASLQFAARAYPALVPNQNLVKAYVTSVDPTGQNWERAKRVGRHMSYQVMYEMESWEENMDKLCLMLPIVGTVFKKGYYDPLKGINRSDLVPAEQLVVNYWSKSLHESPRISQILQFNRNEIEEKFRSKLWREIDLGDPIPYSSFESVREKGKVNQQTEPQLDYTTPDGFIECHTTWDLDEDGYREPWIITVHLQSQKVVRIVPRFNPDKVYTSGKDIIKIDPINYFTKYSFIPNPDGSSVYDVGFGLLLGNINYSLNTLVNQLIDSGTINNLQAGFIGRGIRIKGGALRFQPGEWKQFDSTGDDIKKNIFPMPTKEPSEVLFKLFEAMLQSGKELASIAEIMVGKMPGQNTPATTTQMSVDQSLKIFTAIYKRMYRSLSEEYARLFDLNKENLPDEKTYMLLNEVQDPQNPQAAMQQEQVFKLDYHENVLVKPNADPNTVSEAQRQAKVQSLLQLIPLGTVNLVEATKQALEAQQQENIAALMQPNPPHPNPEQQKMQMEMQMKQSEMQMKQQIEQEKAAMAKQKMELELMIKAQEGKMDMMLKQMELQLKEQENNMKLKHQALLTQMDLTNASHQNEMDMKFREEDMKMKQRESEAKVKNVEAEGAAKQAASPTAKKPKKYKVSKNQDGSKSIQVED